MIIYSIKSYEDLGRALMRRISDASIGRLNFGFFRDGEPFVGVHDLPRGRTVLLAATGPGLEPFVWSTLTIDALKNCNAKKLAVLVPYAGFARQDRHESGSGIPARLIPRVLKLAGAYKQIILDAHSTVSLNSVPGTVNVSALPALAENLRRYSKNAVVAAPDRGARLRAMQLAANLGGLGTVYVEKCRPAPGVAVAKSLKGADVRGKTVIIIDDLIDTGGTMLAAARLIKRHGAKKFVCAATHGVFTGNAIKDLRAVFDDVVVTNSVPQNSARVHVVDAAEILAAAIRSHVR